MRIGKVPDRSSASLSGGTMAERPNASALKAEGFTPRGFKSLSFRWSCSLTFTIDHGIASEQVDLLLMSKGVHGRSLNIEVSIEVHCVYINLAKGPDQCLANPERSDQPTLMA